MADELKKGNISFVNLDKLYATIEYVSNGKKKVNVQLEGEEEARQPHTFRVGDEVSFYTKETPRGDKLMAYDVKFLYNSALHLLIQKAGIENRFTGYLKAVDNKFYVKETDSYLFFPLRVSKWERQPSPTAVNEAITFSLMNLEKPEKMVAELFSHAFIPEYRMAQRAMNAKQVLDGKVSRVTPHAVYVGLFNEEINAKLPGAISTDYKEGDEVKVVITYLSPEKIIIENKSPQAQSGSV